VAVDQIAFCERASKPHLLFTKNSRNLAESTLVGMPVELEQWW